jgi:cytoskeletal protein RodZ
MGSFGEDLRAARISRGIALEDIIEVTKISQRHLVALEQDRFKLLPGGILSKWIVRGYVGTIGLDVREWTERFVKVTAEPEPETGNVEGWERFASNVGRVRMAKREAAELRLRWTGAVVLVVAAAVAGFLSVRYLGMRAGWWNTFLPVQSVSAKTHALIVHTVALARR